MGRKAASFLRSKPQSPCGHRLIFICLTWKIDSHLSNTPPRPKVSFYDRIRLRLGSWLLTWPSGAGMTCGALGTAPLQLKTWELQKHVIFLTVHTTNKQCWNAHRIATVDTHIQKPWKWTHRWLVHSCSLSCPGTCCRFLEQSPVLFPMNASLWLSAVPSSLLALSFESLFLFHRETEFATELPSHVFLDIRRHGVGVWEPRIIVHYLCSSW